MLRPMQHDPFQYFRDREGAESYRAAVLVQGATGALRIREDLLRVCLAWAGSCAVFCAPISKLPDTATEQQAWLWLWEGCSVDIEQESTAGPLLDALGMQYEDARRLMRIAISARIVYPDSTVHSEVQQIAQRALSALVPL